MSESVEKLPSPEELKMKIIIKARKSSGEDAANNEDDDDDGLEESALGSTYSLAAGTLQNTEDVITMDGRPTLQLNTARRASTVTSSVESLLHEPNNHSRAFEEETEITQKTNQPMAEEIRQKDLIACQDEMHTFVEECSPISLDVMMKHGSDTQELRVLLIDV